MASTGALAEAEGAAAEEEEAEAAAGGAGAGAEGAAGGGGGAEEAEAFLALLLLLLLLALALGLLLLLGSSGPSSPGSSALPTAAAAAAGWEGDSCCRGAAVMVAPARPSSSAEGAEGTEGMLNHMKSMRIRVTLLMMSDREPAEAAAWGAPEEEEAEMAISRGRAAKRGVGQGPSCAGSGEGCQALPSGQGGWFWHLGTLSGPLTSKSAMLQPLEPGAKISCCRPPCPQVTCPGLPSEPACHVCPALHHSEPRGPQALHPA